MFALNIVLVLFPEFFFLQIFVLYTFYIVWEGAGPYMQVTEAERLKSGRSAQELFEQFTIGNKRK